MRRRRCLVLSGIISFMAFLNVIAWESTAFCDFYVSNIYPLWVGTLGRITGWFSFSIGEMMIVAGMVLTVIAILSGIAAVIFYIFFKRSSLYGSLINFCKKYLFVYTWIFAAVFAVMTLNCFIPYHCSALEEKYGMLNRISADDPVMNELLSKKYTLEELGQLRDYVVIKANQLSKQVERDSSGNIVYPENMEELAVQCMKSLGEEYEQLSGYYPMAKQFTFSEFFSQQNMKGYFFPFSMEVNYNGIMCEINRPATICHEYAHLKGFMYEEEANMIGFLACINSSDVTFQYSGYLSILNYINNEFYDAIGKTAYASHVKISPQVREDNVFLREETWEKVEEKAVIRTEVVDKVSDKLSETTLVMNGVEDGLLSYTRVVELLLRYYDGSMEVKDTLLAEYEQEYLVQSTIVQIAE